jgi:prevent-host-death family protein
MPWFGFAPQQPLHFDLIARDLAGSTERRHVGGKKDQQIPCPRQNFVVTFLQNGVGAMPITTLTSREFNQDTSRAKKAAGEGPVFITDRGVPAHVLLSIDEYRKLTGGRMTLGEALAQPDVADFDFAPPRATGIIRSADLS